MTIEKIDLALLVPHEEYREEHVLELMEQIKEEGYLLRPIAVSSLKKHGKTGYLIHDGHHRTEALRRLGLDKIVANVIDFESEMFVVKSWKDDTVYKKSEIITYALTNKKFPTKTTKFVVVEDGEEKPFFNNDKVEPKLAVKIEELKEI